MKKSQLLFMLVSVCAALLVAGGKAHVSLSSQEIKVAEKTGFDKQALVIVKEETQGHIHRLTGYQEDGYRIMASGVCADVPEDKSEHILISLRQKLHPIGYMAFVVDMNEGMKTDTIGVLKGSDQYDILRMMQTNGNDYDITNEDVIERLKDWEQCCPFEIIGADNDWVEIEFKKLPKDMKSFAEEVSEFCPGAVDEGARGIEDLVAEISKTKRLFLWWE